MTEAQYQKKIIQMLGILDVKTIYYVDDELEASGPSLDEIVAQLGRLKPEHEDAVHKIIPADVFNVPATAKRGAISSYLNGLDGEQETILVEVAAALGLQLKQPDNAQSLFLKKLFKNNSGNIEVHCIGPKKWQDQDAVTIRAATTTNRIFCLFDQNLTGSSQLGSGASLSGISLIRTALTHDDQREAVFCVLFTGDITGDVLIDSELAYWNKSVADAGLASSQFFPLSKDRIKSNASFAEGLKLSSLNALYDILRLKTVKLLTTASQAAKTELDSVHLYNLNFMVSTTSKNEGVWEADTLIRLHEIIRAEKVKEQMVVDEFAIFFNKNIGKVEQINNLLSYIPEIPVLERHKLRRQELYETSKSLNETHSELKTGDIFRASLDGGTQDFVLLAQPCDLVVRKNGKRKSVVATMAPIRVFASKEECDAHLKKSPSYLKTVFALENYSATMGSQAYVELNSILSVEVKVLDLAVLSKEGKCAITFEHNAQCPKELQSTWQKRFTQLHSDFEEVNKDLLSITKACEAMEAGAEKELILSLFPSPFKDLSTNPTYRVPKPEFLATGSDYKMHRVSSIRPPLSTYLLDIYTKYLSRAAFDHDFSATDSE